MTPEMAWRFEGDGMTLDRHRPILIAAEVAFLTIGAVFWTLAKLQDEAFSVGTYGRFALVFPAEFWAGIMMAASMIAIIGLKKPVRRDMVLLGSLLNALQFLGLAYSAIMTGGEPVIGLFASVMFVPLHVWMAWEAWQR